MEGLDAKVVIRFMRDLLRMKLIIPIIIISIVFSPLANAQSSKRNYDISQAPPWVSGRMPADRSVNHYKIVIGEGESYDSARKAAYSMLVNEIAMEHGASIQTTSQNRISQTIDNSSVHYKQDFSITSIIEYDNFKVSVTKIDEYSEIHQDAPKEGKYCVWQVYVVDSPNASSIHLNYSNKYGIDATLLSIIPGGGQFYKQQYVRGALFLGSEVLAVGSIIYFQDRYKYNMKCSKETPILDLEIEYNKLAQQKATFRNIAIGAASAIWIWNILDASIATGRPHYVNKGLKIAVSSTPQNDILLGFNYTF